MDGHDLTKTSGPQYGRSCEIKKCRLIRLYALNKRRSWDRKVDGTDVKFLLKMDGKIGLPNVQLRMTVHFQ